MLVQVKCKTVVIPISFWHVAARSKDFSLVDPPAPHVTVTNKGLKASIRFNLANKFLNPESVLVGKTRMKQIFHLALRKQFVLLRYSLAIMLMMK